jgi:predicted Zn-dependent protease
MKFTRLIAFLLLFFLLPGPSWSLTLDDEAKYGRQVYVEIARSAKVYSDPYVCLQMAIIKQRLEPAADLPMPIKLSIIDSPVLDAFATVGGYVFMTTGILEQADREEEIVGILGHEFSHVGRRHVSKGMEKEKYISWGSVATVLLALLAPSPAAKAALMTGGMGAGQTLALKYTRENEEEADRFGVATCEKAGYNGAGSADFLRKLSSTSLEKMMPQYLLTHPYSEDRAVRIQQLAGPVKTRWDVSLFPFVIARVTIVGKPLGRQNEDIWLGRYQREPKDPVSIYGAALVYAMKGDTDRAISMVKSMDSHWKPLFLGEFLVNSRRFREAIEVLGSETHPVARYYLARAYEGLGDLQTAGRIFRDLAPYGDTFPEIYQRMGMMFGRLGFEGGGYEFLGRYYLETGRLGAAQMNLEKAVSKYGINSAEAGEVMRLLEAIRVATGQKKRRGG